jgi:anti-sigma regulatory factor (Ser/Thr protein kinase)
MNIRAPAGRGSVGPGELLLQVVDWSGDVSTLAGLFPSARVERSTDVASAIEMAARSRPDVVVLRVPIEEVARADALRLLQSVAPACRVVILPVGPVDPSGDNGGGQEAGHASDPAGLALSPALAPDAQGVVRATTLRPRAESAALARRVVRSACGAAAAEELCFDALLVGTELVTNAVNHAGSDVGLTVRAWPATVRIEVYDGVSERPALRQADVSSGGGRGMAIMNALCSAWGIDPSVKGKTVWAQLVSRKPAPTLG